MASTPDLFGLMDATSMDGVVWLGNRGERKMATNKGPVVRMQCPISNIVDSTARRRFASVRSVFLCGKSRCPCERENPKGRYWPRMHKIGRASCRERVE